MTAMIHSFKDTIAAISTPPGIGAISIIRLSGANSLAISIKIFKSLAAKKLQHSVAHVGYIISDQNQSTHQIIDQVILTYFQAPHSFTGEDIIEISCHGGTFVVTEILNLVLRQGARLADPGEFTQRAFINGKLDLVQAESIIDVIHAQTQEGLKLSFSQLSGRLSEKFMSLKETLREQLGLLELELDFSDDVEFSSRDHLSTLINNALIKIDELLKSFYYGKIIREGAHLVLAGKPNAGKSSILNRLLEEERAIVSEIPGTTRDTIEESLNIDGFLFKITDTAGLRPTNDSIEQAGVKRTQQFLSRADLILMVIDASEENPDWSVISTLDTGKILLLLNKADINKIQDSDLEYIKQKNIPFLYISAKQGSGFKELNQAILNNFFGDKEINTDQIISKQRHRDSLEKIKQSLISAQSSLNQQLSPEFIALDIRGALNAIGEITGEVTTDDILNDIFSRFCIGK